jgi:hypothetical protein
MKNALDPSKQVWNNFKSTNIAEFVQTQCFPGDVIQPSVAAETQEREGKGRGG